MVSEAFLETKIIDRWSFFFPFSLLFQKKKAKKKKTNPKKTQQIIKKNKIKKNLNAQMGSRDDKKYCT